jgi:hypothetical protein
MKQVKSITEIVETEYKEFAVEVSKLDATALKSRITGLQQALEESEEHKNANQALIDARTEVSLLSGPYRDVKKAVKLKTKYILELLKSRAQ